MNSFLRFRAALLVTWLSASYPSVAGAQDVTIDDVYSALQRTEGVIRALSVDSHCEIFQRSLTDPEATVEFKSDEKVIVDSTGRIRSEVDGHAWRVGDDGKPVVRPQKVKSTYDGKLCRILYGSRMLPLEEINNVENALSPASAFITSARDVYVTLDPRLMTTHYHNKPVSELIGAEGGQIVGRTQHEGREVLILETGPVTNRQRWRQRFWIDPALNFTIVKRAQLIQFPSYKRWIEFTRIVGSEFEQIHPQIWLPMRVLHESYNPTEEHARDGSEPPTAWRFDIRNSNWVVNPEIDDSKFTLDFPAGTEVEDQVNNHIYRAGQ